jgi:uncharacterized protein with FMN-binding domain
MRRLLTFLGAAVVGLVGIVAVHGRPRGLIAGRRARHHLTTRPRLPAARVTAVGPAENYGFGRIAVAVTAADGRITDVRVVTLKTLDAYSAELADYALPRLRAEILRAQGLPIRVISGATYTSEGYAYSLQAALRKLEQA